LISRDEPSNVCAIATDTIGGTSLRENDIVNAVMCIGEKVSSFRTLLRSFNTLSCTTVLASSSYKNFFPFGFPTWQVDIATPVTPIAISDLYGNLSSCFLYSRGGVRLKMIPLNDTAATGVVRSVMTYLSPRTSASPAISRIFDSPGTTLQSNAENVWEYGQGPKVLSRLVDGQPLEVLVPQYLRYHSRLNTEHSMNGQYPYDNIKPSLATPFALDVQPIGTAAFNAYRVFWMRAGADDCNFGTFISIPPMVLNTGVAVG
jgi:hypothetical protein